MREKILEATAAMIVAHGTQAPMSTIAKQMRRGNRCFMISGDRRHDEGEEFDFAQARSHDLSSHHAAFGSHMRAWLSAKFQQRRFQLPLGERGGTVLLTR